MREFSGVTALIQSQARHAMDWDLRFARHSHPNRKGIDLTSTLSSRLPRRAVGLKRSYLLSLYFRGSKISKFFWCMNDTTTLADCSVSHCSLVMGKLKIVSP